VQFLYSVPDSVSATRSKYFHCPVLIAAYRMHVSAGTRKIPNEGMNRASFGTVAEAQSAATVLSGRHGAGAVPAAGIS
jgi:hypothetical protein